VAKYNALSLRFLRDKQVLKKLVKIKLGCFPSETRDKINTYAISSFLDRRSSSRSMESSFGTQHPINAGTRKMDRARSSRWKKSLEQDGNDGWEVGGDEKQDLFEGVENEVTERTKKMFGKMKVVRERRWFRYNQYSFLP
jgi:hypothetical protein